MRQDVRYPYVICFFSPGTGMEVQRGFHDLAEAKAFAVKVGGVFC